MRTFVPLDHLKKKIIMDRQQRNWLITGISSGLGKAIAEEVMVASSDKEKRIQSIAMRLLSRKFDLSELAIAKKSIEKV